MRIATWHVDSLPARLPRVLELLGAHRPDVLLVQGTQCGQDEFPDAALAAAGYRAVHHSAGRWAGVAVAVPDDTDAGEVCAGLAGEPSADEARWIEADVDGMRAVSVHVPDGQAVGTKAFQDKLRFLDAMAARVRELAAAGPLMVAGDFNVCPADLDVQDPAALAGSTRVTPAERERFAALLDAGTVDAFRALHPHDPGFTWWEPGKGRSRRPTGMRLDALLLSPGLARRLRACRIDPGHREEPAPSGHAPLLADLA